jgi:hypothetical protein
MRRKAVEVSDAAQEVYDAQKEHWRTLRMLIIEFFPEERVNDAMRLFDAIDQPLVDLIITPEWEVE